MAFTQEDGTGLAAANAYISVAELDAFFADRTDSLTGSPTDEQKEDWIVDATDYIEQRWGGLFRGVRKSSAQALSFPRTGLYDDRGEQIDGIPERFKHGVCRYVYELNQGNALLPNPSTDGAGLVVNSAKLGPLSFSAGSNAGSTPSTFRSWPRADRFFREYINSGGGVVRA